MGLRGKGVQINKFSRPMASFVISLERGCLHWLHAYHLSWGIIVGEVAKLALGAKFDDFTPNRSFAPSFIERCFTTA
jgi:hypothetical protein